MKNHAWFSDAKIHTRPETDKPIGHLQVPFCPIVWFILSQTNDSHIYTYECRKGRQARHPHMEEHLPRHPPPKLTNCRKNQRKSKKPPFPDWKYIFLGWKCIFSTWKCTFPA